MRGVSFRRATAAAAVALVVFCPTFAAAGDTSTAETLFQEGISAMKREDYKAACDAFGGSNEADPSPGTQINLGLCSERQGKLATAWGWYRTAAGLAEQRGQRARADAARVEAARLEPKLHKLLLSLKTPIDGLLVTRDGAAVPAASIGREVPVDPGEHVIEVTAKGKRPFSQKLLIAATPGVDRFEIPALADAEEQPAGAGAPPANAGTPSPDYAPPSSSNDGRNQRTVGFVVGGAGLLALVVAGGLQGLALIVNGQAQTARNNADATTDPARKKSFEDSYNSKKDAAKGDQIAAIVSGGGALVLLGVGATLVFTAPSGKAAKAYVAPYAGASGGGLSVVGAF